MLRLVFAGLNRTGGGNNYIKYKMIEKNTQFGASNFPYLFI